MHTPDAGGAAGGVEAAQTSEAAAATSSPAQATEGQDASAKAGAGTGCESSGGAGSELGKGSPAAAASAGGDAGVQADPPAAATAAAAASTAPPGGSGDLPGDAANASAGAAAGADSSGTASGGGRGKGFKLPSILGELGLKLTTKGILLPESRRVTLQRRREMRELGLLPYTPPPSTADLAGKKRKKQRQKGLGTVLDDEASALFHGAHNGDVEFCHNGLDAGADVNVRTNADMDGIGTGGTALHVAAARGHDEVVRYLLQAGADANLATGRGELPIQLATRLGHLEVVKALSSVSCTTQNAEGAMQLLRTAPSYGNDRKRRKLQAALMEPVPGRPRRPAALPVQEKQPRSGGVWKNPDDYDDDESTQYRPSETRSSETRGSYTDRDRPWNSKARNDGRSRDDRTEGRDRQESNGRQLMLPPPPPPVPDFVDDASDDGRSDSGWSVDRQDDPRDDTWQTSQWQSSGWSDWQGRSDEGHGSSDRSRGRRRTRSQTPTRAPPPWQSGSSSEASQVAQLADKVAELQRQLSEKQHAEDSQPRSEWHSSSYAGPDAQQGSDNGRRHGGGGAKGGSKGKRGKRSK